MKKYKIIVYIILLIIVVACASQCFAIDFIEASTILEQAESEVASAYIAVAQAQNAGADVTELITTINLANDLLSKAYFALRVGNYEDASYYAIQCIESLNGVIYQANSLESEAKEIQDRHFFMNLIGSVLGLFFLVILGFFGWKLLKKWYFKKVLNKAPKLAVI